MSAPRPMDLRRRFLSMCECAALPTDLQDGETRVRGEPPREGPAPLRRAAPCGPEDRSGVEHQGELAPSLDPAGSRGGGVPLETLVLLGDPQPARSRYCRSPHR